MPAPENTNQLSNVTLFLQNLRKKPKNVILGWHDGGKKPQTIIPKAFPHPRVNLWDGGGGAATLG